MFFNKFFFEQRHQQKMFLADAYVEKILQVFAKRKKFFKKFKKIGIINYLIDVRYIPEPWIWMEEHLRLKIHW